MTSLRTLDSRQFVRALGRLGWTVVRTTGGHQMLRKAGHPATLSVPVGPGRVLREGTVRKLLKAAGISEAELVAAF